MAVFTAIGTALGVAGGVAGTLTAASVVGGLAVAGTVGAIAGVANARKAGKAAQAAAERQERAQQLQARRQRRAAIRSNILAQARARASAQAAGTAQSSGLSGAVGAGRSALGSELGFGTQMSGLSSEIAAFQGQAQKYGDLSKLGFKVAGMSAGFIAPRMFTAPTQTPTSAP